MTKRAPGPSYEKPESLQDPLDPQHQFMPTAVPGTNGKKIKVRCRCMAEYKNIDTSRYFNFDPLAVVNSMQEAKRVYDNHLHASAILVGVAKFYQKLEGNASVQKNPRAM